MKSSDNPACLPNSSSPYSPPSVGRVEKSTSYKKWRILKVQPIICFENLKVS